MLRNLQVLQLTQVPPAKLLAARAAASAALAAAQPRLPAESPSEALPAAAAHPPSPSKRKRPRDGDAEDDELAAASRPLKIARDAFNGPVANGTGGPDAAANGRPLPAAKRPGGAGLLQNGHGPCTASAAADAGGGQPAAKGAAAGGGASNAPAPAPAALAAAEASDAGLGEAVGWCRRRMAWDSLLLQLQVGAAVHNLPGPFTADCKGVKAPYSFAICELCIASRLHVCFSSHQLQTSSRVVLVRRRSGRPSQSSSHTGHPAAPPRTLQQGRRRPRRHGRCARCACAASRRSQPWTRQRLSRTSARRRRPRFRPAAADPPGLVLVPGVAGFGSGSGGGGGETEAGGSGFHAVLCSAYLARLAAAGAERSGGGGEGGEEGSVSSRVTQVAGGLSIAYSFAAGAGFSECRLCRSMTCLRNAMSCWLRGACWTSLSCSSRRDLHRAPPDSAHARQTVLSPDIQMILVPKPKRESQHTTIAGCWCS